MLGKYKESLDVIEKVLYINPNHLNSLNNKGN